MLGEAHFRLEHWNDALKYLTSVSREFWRDAHARYMLGTCFMHLGEVVRAEQHLERSLVLEFRRAPLVMLALLNLRKGNHATAREYAHTARKTPPENEAHPYWHEINNVLALTSPFRTPAEIARLKKLPPLSGREDEPLFIPDKIPEEI